MQKPVLLCLPFAGAGASVFNPWRDAARDELDVVALELPGHERRFREPLCRDVQAAVRSILPQVNSAIADRARIVVFGHSLGAVLGFELARALSQHHPQINLARLVFSGSPSPFRPRNARAVYLDNEAFLEHVSTLAGYVPPSLAQPELRKFLLPMLRADVEMHEAYSPPRQAAITVPLTCLRGADDLLVSREDALQWREAVTGVTQYIEHPGGHMYLMEGGLDFIEALCDVCLGREVNRPGWKIFS